MQRFFIGRMSSVVGFILSLALISTPAYALAQTSHATAPLVRQQSAADSILHNLFVAPLALLFPSFGAASAASVILAQNEEDIPSYDSDSVGGGSYYPDTSTQDTGGDLNGASPSDSTDYYSTFTQPQLYDGPTFDTGPTDQQNIFQPDFQATPLNDTAPGNQFDGGFGSQQDYTNYQTSPGVNDLDTQNIEAVPAPEVTSSYYAPAYDGGYGSQQDFTPSTQDSTPGAQYEGGAGSYQDYNPAPSYDYNTPGNQTGSNAANDINTYNYDTNSAGNQTGSNTMNDINNYAPSGYGSDKGDTGQNNYGDPQVQNYYSTPAGETGGYNPTPSGVGGYLQEFYDWGTGAAPAVPGANTQYDGGYGAPQDYNSSPSTQNTTPGAQYDGGYGAPQDFTPAAKNTTPSTNGVDSGTELYPQGKNGLEPSAPATPAPKYNSIDELTKAEGLDATKEVTTLQPPSTDTAAYQKYLFSGNVSGGANANPVVSPAYLPILQAQYEQIVQAAGPNAKLPGFEQLTPKQLDGLKDRIEGVNGNTASLAGIPVTTRVAVPTSAAPAAAPNLDPSTNGDSNIGGGGYTRPSYAQPEDGRSQAAPHTGANPNAPTVNDQLNRNEQRTAAERAASDNPNADVKTPQEGFAQKAASAPAPAQAVAPVPVQAVAPAPATPASGGFWSGVKTYALTTTGFVYNPLGSINTIYRSWFK